MLGAEYQSAEGIRALAAAGTDFGPLADRAATPIHTAIFRLRPEDPHHNPEVVVAMRAAIAQGVQAPEVVPRTGIVPNPPWDEYPVVAQLLNPPQPEAPGAPRFYRPAPAAETFESWDPTSSPRAATVATAPRRSPSPPRPSTPRERRVSDSEDP